jgi:hypothetical protein
MRTIKQYNIQRRLRNVLNNKWDVVLGNRGGIDTGLVFAPYIPVQLDPVMLDNQIVGVSSRYGSVQVNPNNYGVINMPNVNGRIFV